ncbi:hypothetical protein EYZ11_005486 [Aspergillus tanneri]|uniref:Enoyl reductase (ER) domain-containing protein n=1 Tax=Aspergillus tanneri TaxID=1220188 RepID=A0A4S3JKB9_9EURO|nr:hypothetical protein EYZ11_005486 [Aspergillus tanneri]
MKEESNASILQCYRLAERVLRRIHDLFDDKVDGLELLMENDGLQNMYGHMSTVTNWDTFLSLLSHTNPTLRILEIGGGTGGATSACLKGLASTSGHSGRMYSKYTFTDISAGFVTQAKEKFKEFSGVEFLILDISRDITEQGFEMESYDLIVASNVIHTTPKISESLDNIKKLLVPGGWLLLQEVCPSIPVIDYIAGVLPSWWPAEDSRETPYLSPEEWHQELVNAGFTGAEVVRYDNDIPYHMNANIVSRIRARTTVRGHVNILHSGTVTDWARSLEHLLLSKGFSIKWLNLHERPPLVTNVISLLDLEGPFFHEISNADFYAFQRFTQNIQGCFLWLTRPIQLADKDPDPRFALALGMMRTLRQEIVRNTATLEVDRLDGLTAEAVIHIYMKMKDQEDGESSAHPEYEFILKEGAIHVGRFQWNSLGDVTTTLNEPKPRALDVGCPGLLDSLTWTLAGRAPTLEDADIEVDIKFVGLNFKDIMVSMGLVGDTGEQGLEASGIVRNVGPGVTNIQIGDRISIARKGLMRTRIILPARCCVVVPDNLSLEDAAAGPCVFMTAMYSLIHCGNLQKGQSVLIHSACGGVGLAAIQICQLIGTEIFVTVGNKEKATHLMENFSIAEDHIFDSRSTSFLQDILKKTKNIGVDLVLNSLSGELLHASWKCVAPFGKMIELGKRDFIGHGKLDMDLFQDNRSFIGVDLLEIGYKRPQLLQRLMKQFLEYFRDGKIGSIRPVSVYEASNISKAFRYMQTGQHIGKILIRMPDDPSTIPVSRLEEKGALFRHDASYLLIGGFGGLGRTVATWMVEKGARHFIIMSRSGQEAPQNRAFVEDLESQEDVHVISISGTASRIEDVRKAVAAARKPIAGVIQMSMVLQVGLVSSNWKGSMVEQDN